jgi:molybdate transport system substrate-binding protein
MKRYMLVIFTVLLSLFLLSPVHSQSRLRIAVAANYIQPFNEIKAAFEKKYNFKVEAVFSSTGSLYNQIMNGAPYDIFLAADNVRPATLFQDGLSDKPFVYAEGRVILWSGNKNFCKEKDWRKSLTGENLKRIAVANPSTAPYGTSAMKALSEAGLSDKLMDKTVTAQTVAQSFQYASTGAVDAAFCALSAAFTIEGGKGCYYVIDEAPPVIQSACVLKRNRNPHASKKFADFLKSAEALEIKSRYGYR